MITEFDLLEMLNDSAEFTKDVICDELHVTVQDFTIRGCFEYHFDQLIFTISNQIYDTFSGCVFQNDTEIVTKVCDDVSNKYDAFLAVMREERVFMPGSYTRERLHRRVKKYCDMVMDVFIQRLRGM